MVTRSGLENFGKIKTSFPVGTKPRFPDRATCILVTALSGYCRDLLWRTGQVHLWPQFRYFGLLLQLPLLQEHVMAFVLSAGLSVATCRLLRRAVVLFLIFICPCITNIFPNYNQQDATFLDLFISTDTLRVSGGSSAHHQEHITVHTASGIVKQYCCLLLSWMRWNS